MSITTKMDEKKAGNMKRQNGFSLLEMSMVLMIIGMLLSAFTTPLHHYHQQRKMFAVCDEIARIRQALLDFTVVHGRMPWAAAKEGIEIIGKEQGNLPWKTLGLNEKNEWKNPYQYQVMKNWADKQPDPPVSGECDIQQSLNNLSVNFCSRGQLQVKQAGSVVYHKAVAIVTQPHAHKQTNPPCEARHIWLSAENILGYLVMAGRLY